MIRIMYQSWSRNTFDCENGSHQGNCVHKSFDNNEIKNRSAEKRAKSTPRSGLNRLIAAVYTTQSPCGSHEAKIGLKSSGPEISRTSTVRILVMHRGTIRILVGPGREAPDEDGLPTQPGKSPSPDRKPSTIGGEPIGRPGYRRMCATNGESERRWCYSWSRRRRESRSRRTTSIAQCQPVEARRNIGERNDHVK